MPVPVIAERNAGQDRLNLRTPEPFSVGNAGAIGDGLADDYNALFEAAKKQGTSGAIFLPPGTYAVGTSLTIACQVIFAFGAKLKPDTGVTVTLAGPVTTAPGDGIIAIGTGGTVNVTGPLNAGGVLDVRTFGAKGDGVTDDTAAIQRAFGAAPDGGVVRFASGGEYLYTGEVIVLNRALTIEGEGAVLVGGGAASNIFALNAPLTVLGLTVRGCPRAFVLSDGTDATVVTSNTLGLGSATTTDISGISFRDCVFENCERPIIGFMEGPLVVDSVSITGCRFSGGFQGVFLEIRRLNDVVITGNTFADIDGTGAGFTAGGNPILRGAGRAIYLGYDSEDDQPDVGRWVVANNTIRGITDTRDFGNTLGPEVQAIRAHGATTVVIANNAIEDVTSTGTNAAGDCDGIYTKCVNLSITGNTLRNAGMVDGAITIKGVAEVAGRADGHPSLIAHNSILVDDGVERLGILVEPVRDVIVQGNLLRGVGRENGGVSAAIVVQARAAQNISVLDNIIRDCIGAVGISSRAWGSTHVFRGNLIDGVSGEAMENDTDTSGILIDMSVNASDATPFESLVVAGNVVSRVTKMGTSTDHGVQIRASLRDIDNLLVDGNKVVGAITRGIRLFRSSTFVYNSPHIINNSSAQCDQPILFSSGALVNPSFANNRGYDSVGVSADRGNVGVTLVLGVDKATQVFATTLTADRAVGLSGTNSHEGGRFRIVRSAAGAFNLNVGTGPLKALAQDEWCEVTHNGSAWVLTAFGTL
jgi:hypothetical protein